MKGLNTLGHRVLAIQMHDLNEVRPQGHDVPWGTGAGKTGEIIREMHRLGLKPTMIGVEYSYNWLESMPEIARSIEFFNEVTLNLAK